jgi:hypothetical protein
MEARLNYQDLFYGSQDEEWEIGYWVQGAGLWGLGTRSTFELGVLPF